MDGAAALFLQVTLALLSVAIAIYATHIYEKFAEPRRKPGEQVPVWPGLLIFCSVMFAMLYIFFLGVEGMMPGR